MNKNANYNLYHVWYKGYKHICDTPNDFRQWVKSLPYYNAVATRYGEIKLYELNGRHIVLPKQLYMQLFLKLGRGYRKNSKGYSVWIQKGDTSDIYGKFENEVDAAEQYVRAKITLVFKKFGNCPKELIKEIVNEFVNRYSEKYKIVNAKDFLI